jgi:hypothetical protein
MRFMMDEVQGKQLKLPFPYPRRLRWELKVWETQNKEGFTKGSLFITLPFNGKLT